MQSQVRCRGFRRRFRRRFRDALMQSQIRFNRVQEEKVPEKGWEALEQADVSSAWLRSTLQKDL